MLASSIISSEDRKVFPTLVSQEANRPKWVTQLFDGEEQEEFLRDIKNATPSIIGKDINSPATCSSSSTGSSTSSSNKCWNVCGFFHLLSHVSPLYEQVLDQIQKQNKDTNSDTKLKSFERSNSTSSSLISAQEVSVESKEAIVRKMQEALLNGTVLL